MVKPKFSLSRLLILIAFVCMLLALASRLVLPVWSVGPAVRHIRQQGGTVGPRSIVDPFFIPSTNTIRHVDFHDSGLKDEDLVELIPSLSSLPNLRVLTLTDTRVGDVSARQLTQLRGLWYLYIDGTSVSEDGRRYLWKTLPGTLVR